MATANSTYGPASSVRKPEPEPERKQLGQGADRNKPAWMMQEGGRKHVCLCPVRVLLSKRTRKPMPIAVRNGLPSIIILMASGNVNMLVLVDMCAAVSVRNYDSHRD